MGYSFDRIWDKTAYPVKLHAPVGAKCNYTCRASGMGVDCIDGLSQYRTQTQSSYCIHPYPSDFLSVAK
ncbi:MAG: hypothetical protein WCQ90_03060 [Deltaproteobacteria bacterium]